MFLPDNSALNERKLAETRRKEAFRNIEKWSLELMPEAIRDDAFISSQEVVCGDPECSPIDTLVSIIFDSDIGGSMGIPNYAHKVTKEELQAKFPTKDILQKWHQGEMAEWPPTEPQLPELRFDVGTRVSCRIGPDPERDWMYGVITQLWYAEQSWPEGSYAPYKVQLDDGRKIFAPGDIDQVIRKVDYE